MDFYLKDSEKCNHIVGANCVRLPTREIRTMRNFVSKRNATFLPSLERGGGPHMGVFEFSFKVFSALK